MLHSFLCLAEIALPTSNKNHFSIIPAVNNTAAVRPCTPYKPTWTAYRLFSSGIVPDKRWFNTFFFLIQSVLDRLIFRDHLVMILKMQDIFSHIVPFLACHHQRNGADRCGRPGGRFDYLSSFSNAFLFL